MKPLMPILMVMAVIWLIILYMVFSIHESSQMLDESNKRVQKIQLETLPEGEWS